MCEASKLLPFRRAEQFETLFITLVGKLTFLTSERDNHELCVCLRTGDQVRFSDLPAGFQAAYKVPADAEAKFVESDKNDRVRDHRDSFDFGKGVCVALAKMPHVSLDVTELCREIQQAAVPQNQAAAPTLWASWRESTIPAWATGLTAVLTILCHMSPSP